MKTKNIFKSLALAMLMPAMLFTTSCSKDDDLINKNENTAKETYKIPVTVNVTRQGDEPATRAIYNESTKKLSFSEGDKLFVYGCTDDVYFAGTLTWQSGGTFSGELDMDGTYLGTAEELFTEASTGENFIDAILQPNGWETYGFQTIGGDGPLRYFDPDFEKAVAADLATAVEQFSLERATTYSSGFALEPDNAIVNCSYKSATTIAEGTLCKPYISSPDEDFGGDVEIPFGSGNIVNFAIAIPAYNVTWSIEDKSSIISTINLGKKEIVPGHIYNVKNYSATPTLLSVTVTDPDDFGVGAKTIYYYSGETWGEAITNHPTENNGWYAYNGSPTIESYSVWDLSLYTSVKLGDLIKDDGDYIF